jgi:hypothetical protein
MLFLAKLLRSIENRIDSIHLGDIDRLRCRASNRQVSMLQMRFERRPKEKFGVDDAVRFVARRGSSRCDRWASSVTLISITKYALIDARLRC